jgi:type I restriction enzyme, S subunit
MRTVWQWKPLGEVCKTGSGGTPLKDKKLYYDNGTIPWLMSGEVSQGDVRHATKFITQHGLDNSAAKLFPENTVLVAMYGATAGQIGILRFEATTNQAVCGILPSNQFIPEFLFYFLLSRKDELVAQATGNAQPNISQIKIRNTLVPIVEIPEQKRIVAVLEEAFEGIATAKTNAEKSLQSARAIFESQLQSVFTERGKRWKQKTLDEVATTFGRGKSKHRPRNAAHLYGGKYPFVQTGDIRNADHIITEYSQTYSEAGLAQSRLWPKGTVCITIAANIAETAILGFEACFPDSVIGVVVNPKEANVGFVEYLLQSFKVRIQAMGKGSAQANINMGTFENERFPFPSVTEQQVIVAELDGLNRETQRLVGLYERKLAALQTLSKSLLHRAFAGELTANKTSELIEAVA